MSPDLFFWVLSRVTGLASFASLAIAIVTGVALRTALFDWLSSNRAIRGTHEFTTILWIPLGLLHVATIVLDQTARITLLDLFVPFVNGYYHDYALLAIGLGAISFDLFIVVTITSWLRSRMNPHAWRWIHRLSYLAFGVLFFHALLGGSDFSAPVVSAIAWSAAFAIGIMSLARLLWGRLPA
ncbi:MAG: hypothetical protein E6J02_12355 [Chloroflexi bacterium]|nr:MAG: hypothetical protein E6J02_12355 [Chloroflexota bacterium]